MAEILLKVTLNTTKPTKIILTIGNIVFNTYIYYNETVVYTLHTMSYNTYALLVGGIIHRIGASQISIIATYCEGSIKIYHILSINMIKTIILMLSI
jgi:hypothetical protein